MLQRLGSKRLAGMGNLGLQQRVLLFLESSSSWTSYSTGSRLSRALSSTQTCGASLFLRMEDSMPLQNSNNNSQFKLHLSIHIIGSKQQQNQAHFRKTPKGISGIQRQLRRPHPFPLKVSAKLIDSVIDALGRVLIIGRYMDKRQIDLISKKMRPSEVLLDLVPVLFLGSSGQHHENTLGITSEVFYFIHNNCIKKRVPIANIIMVTVSAFSQEMVFHCEEDDIRLSSFQNAQIFKNILKTREKVLRNSDPLTVLLEREKQLGKYAGEDDKKKGLMGWFSRHSHNSDTKSRSSMSSNRKSYNKLMVCEKTFLKEISQAIYECRHEDSTQLLHIGGNYGFYFEPEEYKNEEVNPLTYLFINRTNKETFIMHRIKKQNTPASEIIHGYLDNYRLRNNQEEILFATESEEFFDIVSPYSSEQTNFEAVLDQHRNITELDMVSIFYKLMGVIDGEVNIYSSLHPRHIVLKDNIFIASALCINSMQINLNYLAPEELDPDIVVRCEPELINFWKIGILLYQLAFHAHPFPIQYLAELTIHNKHLRVFFPPSSRTPEFRQFICQILQIDADKRGGGSNWKKKIFQHQWIKQTMR